MSIQAVRPIQNTSPLAAIEGAQEESPFQRVWKSVADFFLYIARKIKEGAIFVWTKLKTWCLYRVPANGGPMSDSLIAKLEPYKNMPDDGLTYLLRSIENARIVLQRTDWNLTAELQQKLGVDAATFTAMRREGNENFTKRMAERNPPIPPEKLPLQLDLFNEGLESFDPVFFITVMEAALRAYIFDANSSIRGFPDYFTNTESVAGESRPEILGGGRFTEHREVNYKSKLDELKHIFNSLPSDKREIIVDSFNCEPAQLDLPEEGKKIITDIRAFSNLLTQHNQSFIDHLQQATQILYAPDPNEGD